MSGHVIETVTFRLVTGTDPAGFAAAAREMNGWVAAMPGFVARRLSRAVDGTWIEHVEWQSMEAARAAAAGIGTAAETARFRAAIDGPSVEIRHSALEVAVN